MGVLVITDDNGVYWIAAERSDGAFTCGKCRRGVIRANSSRCAVCRLPVKSVGMNRQVGLAQRIGCPIDRVAL